MDSHFHIRTTSDEDNEFAGTSIYWALDAIRTELAELADYEYQGISVNGDNGDFESAYRAFQELETYGNVIDNVDNILKQHSLPATSTERAPLYQVGNDDAIDAANARLHASAEYVMNMVNSDTPLYMWRCSDNDVVPVTDSNTDIDGSPAFDGVGLYE